MLYLHLIFASSFLVAIAGKEDNISNKLNEN